MGNFIFSIALFSSAATFLFQILTFSQVSAVIPVLLIFTAFAIRVGMLTSVQKLRFKATLVDGLVVIFAILVLIKLNIYGYGASSLVALVSAALTYLTPCFFYFYVRIFVTREHRRYILFPLVLAGMFSAYFMLFDSVSRLVFHTVPWFSNLIYEYSKKMMGYGDLQMNTARIIWTSRPMGIMVSHSHSATWIAIGSFSLIACLRGRHIRPILLISLLVLVLGMNYTSLIAFFISVVFVFPLGLLKIRSSGVFINRQNMSRMFGYSIAVFLLLLAVVLVGGSVGKRITRIIYEQTKFIFGEGAAVSYSYLDLSINNIRAFVHNSDLSLVSFLFGAIPSTNSEWQIGGDTGILDSVFFLGVPFYAIIMVFVIMGIVKARKMNKAYISFLRRGFSLNDPGMALLGATLLFILVMDCHYNVWLNKSVQIALFTILGVFTHDERTSEVKNV